jgi:hypothetical protein
LEDEKVADRGAATLSGRLKPSPRLQAANGERTEERFVIRNSPPVRRGLEQDKRPADLTRTPTQATGHSRCGSALRIQASEEVLQIGDDRLDLYNQNYPLRCVESEQIDATSFTEMVVASLRSDLPSPSMKNAGKRVLEGGMVRIEQTIQFATAPAQPPTDIGTKGVCHASEEPRRQQTSVSVLDKGNARGAYARLRRQICLTPAQTMAQGADCSSQSGVVHSRTLRGRHVPAGYRPALG